MPDYELKSGTPNGFIELYCEKCGRSLLKLPLGCTVVIDRGKMMGNAGCLLGDHPVTVRPG